MANLHIPDTTVIYPNALDLYNKFWPKDPPVLVETNNSLSNTPKEAIKADTGKTQWDLMPFEAIEEINKVLEFGAKKYSKHNWREGNGFNWTRVLNSLLRHTFAFMRGEDNDPESGLSHLAHMGCNIIFLIYYNKYKEKYNKDDRNE